MDNGIEFGVTSKSVISVDKVTTESSLYRHGNGFSVWPDFLTGQPGQPVRVLLVDDDPHMRRVIAQELLADTRINLLAQACSLREGRRLIGLHEFDVMMVDLNLGDGTGFDLIEHMKTLRPMAEAIVISAMEDEEHALHAFELGATGYLVKNSWFGNFSQAVLQVVNGGASITPNLARRLLQKMDHSRHSEHCVEHACGTKDRLSDREKEVLKMVASGYTSQEIGTRMLLSGHTVNTHIKNIYRKLNVRTRAQAVNFAAHRGLF
ncbi:response regulator transcription factor [Polaromonas jejuensis]|uniref:LuxR C-terminal-related transcriptional regulator n=1 Tax=Polaromonas jejuensis TaxID=457502 RepID=A0ABW0QIE8_9BURK|nr:response regulator transcription factor [Polaromonas jejuensis]